MFPALMDAAQRSHTGTWVLFMLSLVAPYHVVECLEPVSLSIAAASTVALTSYVSHRLYCRLTQKCDEEKPFSITASVKLGGQELRFENMVVPEKDSVPKLRRSLLKVEFPALESFPSALKADLTKKLFGQPLAKVVIIRALTNFMSSENPQKPLTLSLHGWTGTGKNLVSKIIVENIYKLGMKSKCVRLFVSSLHFPHDDLVALYKGQLHTWIRENVRQCDRSIFIFDEMEKLNPVLIDAIKPFLDYYDHIDGVSYRKSIFIFLSMASSEQVNEDVVTIAKERHSLQLQDLDFVFSKLFSNRILWHRSLIGKSLIDFSIPFLPLEFDHVKRCILAELRQRGLREDEELASRVAKEMTYFPKDSKMFSDKGCKSISTQVLMYL